MLPRRRSRDVPLRRNVNECQDRPSTTPQFLSAIASAFRWSARQGKPRAKRPQWVSPFSSISWQGSALMLEHDTFWRNSREAGLRMGRFGAVSAQQLTALALPAAVREERARDIPVRGRVLDAFRAHFRAGAVVLTLVGPLAASIAPTEGSAQAVGQDAMPVKDRNIDVSREGATKAPRSEDDQALVDGWPLYRTERGQAAFNDAMATLKATDHAAPASGAFKGCEGLQCNLSLPVLGADGWIPPGRLWVSPTEYVLFVHSPRLRDGQSYRRRASRDMRYFVFHEFHNSTRNTDPFDTISSHSGSVFVSFYMSKQWTDAKRTTLCDRGAGSAT